MTGDLQRRQRNSNHLFIGIAVAVLAVLLLPRLYSKLRPKPHLPAILAETVANCPNDARETVYRRIGKASIAILCADAQQQKAAELSAALASSDDEGVMCYRSSGGGHVRHCKSGGLTSDDDWQIQAIYRQQALAPLDPGSLLGVQQKIEPDVEAPLRLVDGFYCSDQRSGAETMCFSRLRSPSLSWSVSISIPGNELSPELLQRQLQRALRYLAAHVTDPV